MDQGGRLEQNKVVNIEDYKYKKIINENGSLREFTDRYEHCVVKDYENLYEDFQCHSIGIAEVFVQLLTVKDDIIMVSIDFPKDIFGLRDIVDYLDFYGVKLMGECENFIANAVDIMVAVKFRGRAIVIYEKGYNIIPIHKEKLREVTEEFDYTKVRIDTSNSKKRISLLPTSKIILDDTEIDYIPEMELDLTKDLIISNGHIMVASYIGNYGDCIGFLEKKGDDLPVSWIHDMDTIVYIDTHVNGTKVIVNVQHNYVIDIQELR